MPADGPGLEDPLQPSSFSGLDENTQAEYGVLASQHGAWTPIRPRRRLGLREPPCGFDPRMSNWTIWRLDDLESRLEDQGRLIREQWASIAVLGNHIQEAEAGTSPRCTSCLFLGSSLAAAFAGGAIGRRCGHFASPALANSAADRGRGGLRTGSRRSLPVHGAGGVSLELVDGRGGQADRDRLATSVGSRFHFDVPLGRESKPRRASWP